MGWRAAPPPPAAHAARHATCTPAALPAARLPYHLARPPNTALAGWVCYRHSLLPPHPCRPPQLPPLRLTAPTPHLPCLPIPSMPAAPLREHTLNVSDSGSAFCLCLPLTCLLPGLCSAQLATIFCIMTTQNVRTAPHTHTPLNIAWTVSLRTRLIPGWFATI